MISSKTELQSYVKETLSLFRRAASIAESKNKTLKIKAAKAVFIIFINRLEGVEKILSSGNGVDVHVMDVTFLKGIYDPVLQYWTEQLVD